MLIINRHGVPLFEGVKRKSLYAFATTGTVTSLRREFSRKSSEYFFYGTEIVDVATA